MASCFDDYEIEDIEYSRIKGHPLIASVLKPKSLLDGSCTPGRLPVLVFWHGGGFVVGHRLHEAWWPDWLIEYATLQNAIIVAPDYRLMPEASGADILDDVEAFWTWLSACLSSHAETGLWKAQPDLQRILCVGQSSGGCMAVGSALLKPEVGIKAVVSLYAPLYPHVPDFTVPRPRRIMGTMPPSPGQAEARIRNYMKQKTGNVRTAGDAAGMWDLLLCLLQQGRLTYLWTARPDSRLDAVSLLLQAKTLPSLWVIHGEDDSVIPPRCSSLFLDQVKASLPCTPVLMSSLKGEHNFDVSLTLETDWLREGCQFLSKFW
ncbi:hypothetical protein DOTSEDRAFT_90348 [Dothistroma septosporum NZE10]|uniref:Alpha/beta hydrolase fold-3 domain-containing protein n=1 Tax=Dothistroma septosporum (strain NZE10 / CBS 128990) TaxID=675120 RepID=N1PH99_DOTSN|nr:hypothetical protein DOTSEDRAFT_90348 [Dothistroma septosporum NZE10]